MRFRKRHVLPPFSTASKLVRPNVTDAMWDEEMTLVRNMRRCCLHRGVMIAMLEAMVDLKSKAAKLVFSKKVLIAWANVRPASLAEEHWHTFQRGVAAGDNARPTTFARQANEVVHQNVVRRFESETGVCLGDATEQCKERFKVVTKPRYSSKASRPNQPGNVMFPFAAELRKTEPHIPWAEVKARWGNLSESEQDRRLQQQRLNTAMKQTQRSTTVAASASRDEPIRGPWKLGNEFPTTAELLDDVLTPFSTRASGCFGCTEKRRAR